MSLSCPLVEVGGRDLNEVLEWLLVFASTLRQVCPPQRLCPSLHFVSSPRNRCPDPTLSMVLACRRTRTGSRRRSSRRKCSALFQSPPSGCNYRSLRCTGRC